MTITLEFWVYFLCAVQCMNFAACWPKVCTWYGKDRTHEGTFTLQAPQHSTIKCSTNWARGFHNLRQSTALNSLKEESIINALNVTNELKLLGVLCMLGRHHPLYARSYTFCMGKYPESNPTGFYTEPLQYFVQLVAIDCGPFDSNSCIYHQRMKLGNYGHYILMDAARIVKRITRVIRGTADRDVTLVFSLGNGTYMNLDYKVMGSSQVEMNQTDPFYFSHKDLLKLYRETTFPICIYRKSDTLHSLYFPCRDRLPRDYFWDQSYNTWAERSNYSVYGIFRKQRPYMYNTMRSCSVTCGEENMFHPSQTGLFCEHNMDECAYNLHDCPEGRDCHDTNTSYYCECPAGKTGADCTDDVNECEERVDNCSMQSECINTHGSYKCQCLHGFTGKYCTELLDYCDIYKPCKNGAKCHPQKDGYYCACAGGYTGKNCTVDIDECASNPCGKHGTCSDELNKYACNCTSGYTGWNCDTEINICKEKNLNCSQGMCVRTAEAKYQCECFPGFTGRSCEEDINECDGPVCGANGICLNVVGSYNCTCIDGYYGDHCEHEYNECESSPCRNGGYCLDGVNDYECLCQVGYYGTHCEQVENHCETHECTNGGTCENLPYGYRCICPSYTLGTFCEEFIDICADEQLCGDGYCLNLKGNYKCICEEGFTGRNCESRVNHCENIKCKNGGKCTSTAEKYSCNCPEGTYGAHCEAS